MITEEMFQSTPPRGDDVEYRPLHDAEKFQSTPRVGAMHQGTLVVVDVFQSTPRVCDAAELPDL